MAVTQKVDDQFFLFTRMILDFCGYQYTKSGEITPRQPASTSYGDVHGGNWLPYTFPRDKNACIQIMYEEGNNYIIAHQDKHSIFFVQDELMKRATDAWYMEFPILNFHYEPGAESWFFWRRHAMIGKINKSKLRVYRISDDIINLATNLDAEQRLSVENMTKVLDSTTDKPLSAQELEEEIPEIVNFFQPGY